MHGILGKKPVKSHTRTVAGEIRELTSLIMNRNKNQEIGEHFLRKNRITF
jgi:hypothetical protein